MNSLRGLPEFGQALRGLVATKRIALTVVLALALGVGGSAGVFSLLKARALGSLPYKNSDALVQLYTRYPGLGVDDSMNSVPDHLDRLAAAPALADSALFHRYSFDFQKPDGPQRLAGVVATPSLFSTLEVDAAIGRVFVEAEALAAADRVVVISHSFWSQQFGNATDILERSLRLNGELYRIIGVMPPDFVFPHREVRLWVPFVFTEWQRSDESRGFEFAESVGRLQPGATQQGLQSQLDAIVSHTIERLGARPGPDGESFQARALRTGFALKAEPLSTRLNRDLLASLWLLQAAALLLWLIACANSGGLLLMRQHARLRETRVRAALGATGAHLYLRVLSECLLLAFVAGLLSVLVAAACMGLIRQLGMDGAEFGLILRMDATVLVYIAIASLISAVLCSLPSWLALRRLRPLPERSPAPSSASVPRRARNALVLLQICVSVALLLLGAVLYRSYQRVIDQSPGFRAEGLVTASLQLSRDRYPQPQAAAELQQRLLAAVRSLPGVEAAGSASGLPFSTDFDSNPYYVDGPMSPKVAGSGYYQVVDAGFFATLRIPVLRGRGIQDSDSMHTEPVAVVDQSLASHAFGDADPIGRRIATRGQHGLEWRRIVGVVGTIKRTSLTETDGSPTFYFPVAQQPGGRIFRVLIRSDLPLEGLARSLRAALATIDPEQPLFDLMPMSKRIDASLAARRAVLGLVATFALTSFALTLVGLYTVASYSVSLRRGEFAVRIALGASAGRLIRGVLSQSLTLAGIGALLGLGAGYLLLGVMRSELFGIAALDPLAVALVLSAVFSTVMLATLPSALRAARTAPSKALGSE